MSYQLGDKLTLPKSNMKLVPGALEPGRVFKATDLDDLKFNDGETLTYETYRLRIDEVLEDSCICTFVC